MNTRILSTLTAGLFAAAVGHAADYGDWSGSRDIVLNTSASGANVTEDVVKFPVLIRLSEDEAAIMQASKAGGADIRFSKADNSTPLPYEIENWEPWGASIWVLVDTVYGNNSTQKIVMHYGNPNATSESNPAAVYDTANGYVSAWHFGNGPGSIRPSAVAGAPFAFVHNSDNATSVKGLIGRADTLRHFSNAASTSSEDPLAGNWIELNRDSSGAALATPFDGYTSFTDGFSYSLWTRPAGTASHWRMLVLAPEDATQAGDRILFMGDVAGDPTQAAVRWTNGCGWVDGPNPCNFSNSMINGQWNHVFATKAPGNGPVLFYVNGELKGTSSNVNNASEVARSVAWIGRAGDNNPYFAGLIDNATLAATNRSAAFIKLSYENQKAVNTLADIGLGGPVTSTPYGEWEEHRTITLNTSATGAKVTGDVYDFPVLIRLTQAEAAIMNDSKAGGADIRFSKIDDATPLDFHIESWDSTGAAIWVKVDTVKGNNATQAIRMHWKNAAASAASNAAAVFDTADGFVATYHMNGDSVETNVSGHAELNAAVTGSVPAVKGLIGKARSYAGTTENYLSVPNSAEGKLNFSSETNYTLSAWVYSEETSFENRGIFNKGNDQWLIGVYGGDADKFYDVMTRGGGGYNQAATTDITTASGFGVWRHVVGVWKGAGTPQDTARIYIDGKIANTTFFNDILNESDGRDMSTDVYIGVLWENGGLTRPYHGRIDEVIASKVYRDSNWVKLAYENQKPGNALVDIGTYQTPTPPSAPRSVTALASTTTTGMVTVSWQAPATAGTSAITTYTVTGTPGGSCSTSGALTCNVTGLTAGTSYTFKVVAINNAGSSVASAASNAVTAPSGVLPSKDAFVIRMDGTGNPYSYRIPASAAAVTERLTMTITDLHGKRVWSRTVNPSATSVNAIEWDGRNTNGMRVSAGMYMVRIRAVSDGVTSEAVRTGVKK